MEELLHYIWKYRLFPMTSLKSDKEELIEVIDTGLLNRDAGPDFFNAKIKIGDTVWVGNVEIHLQSSDWYRHHHDIDKSYDSTILHVVGEIDKSVQRTNGETIPQLVLPVSPEIVKRYGELKRAEYQPQCFSIISTLNKMEISSWLSTLQVERLELKYNRIIELFDGREYMWKDIFFITLARNFGFGLNGDTFERWAKRLPFRALDKHRDNLFQLESLFFGLSGLLVYNEQDKYANALITEFEYLKAKFQLNCLDLPWKLSKVRPSSFPHARIAQLADFYHRQANFVDCLTQVSTINEIYALLDFKTSEYWNTNFTFGKESKVGSSSKEMTKKTKDLIIINTVVPFLYAYAKNQGDELLMERVFSLLAMLKPENNYITRLWDKAGVVVNNAADSQALIQLQKEYCDKRKCIYCRFGYRYMKVNN